MIEDDEDEDEGEIVSVIEGRGILKRELGLTGASAAGTDEERLRVERLGTEGTERVVRPRYTDDDLDSDEGGENFFVATGHRLWNSISNKVDDLRTKGAGGGGDNEDEEGGLLGRIQRPKWMKRGDSGVSVWRLPRWGRSEDEGRVVL